jgi:RNA polymerase sigma-70 factor (ECF subfamily)
MIPDTSLDFQRPDFHNPALHYEDRRQEARLSLHEPINVSLNNPAMTVCAVLTNTSLCGFQICHENATAVSQTFTLCCSEERVTVRTVWEQREHGDVKIGLLREEVYLIQLVRNGYTEALWQLMAPHMGVLRKFAFSILQSHEDTDDVLQEVMIKVLIHCGQFHPGRSFRAWLMQITRNEAFKLLGSIRHRGAVAISTEGDISGPNTIAQLYSCGMSPADLAERNELRCAIENEVARLGTKYRQVFLLRHSMQLEMPEVARQLGITVDAANTRLHRAHEAIRARLTANKSRARGVASKAHLLRHHGVVPLVSAADRFPGCA